MSISFRHAEQTGNPARSARELVAIARRAGLDARERRHGFEIREGDRRLMVRATDPEHITLATMELVNGGTDRAVFALALALVPTYGPIVVTDAIGRFVVDGSRDVLDAYRATFA